MSHGAAGVKLFRQTGPDCRRDRDYKTSSSGARRSTYCFRHTYATFRLTEGVDVYFLAKQMGTSVKMIEVQYADRILLGLRVGSPMQTVSVLARGGNPAVSARRA